MHIVLIDATRLVGQPDGSADGHGVSALARMARREGIRVTRLDLPGDAADLPRPWLSVLASCDVVHGVVAAERLTVLANVVDGARPSLWTIVDLPPPIDGGSVLSPHQAVLKAAQCVVRSEHAALQWRLAAPQATFRVLPRGIDLLALMPTESSTVQRLADLAPDGPRRTLACAGPFDTRSGVDTLLRAFAAVEGADLRLRLLGAFDLGTTHGHFCSALVSADARISVEAAPTISSLASIAQEVDLICLPNLDPLAFAQPVHEGAALGVFCLATDLGAQAEAVRNFGCGVCIAPGDVPAWTVAIAQWASHFAGRSAAAVTAPLPMRVEEEAFLYESLCRKAIFDHQRVRAAGRG
jgi:glycosyltransferase involved in cell wall biosynthesis